MMPFDFSATNIAVGDHLIDAGKSGRWGVDSEYGRLTDVMLSAPRHLEIVPCNAVSIENHRNGVACSPDIAVEQHARLVRAFEAEGVRCHFVPPSPDLPDLSFTRDTTLMTPWGLIGLRPAVGHRLPEVEHVRTAARSWGVPMLGTIGEGSIEGGDVCLVRPGLVVIGYSGERTDRVGAEALARVFETRGWTAILTEFDRRFLHLDTQFTMLDERRAIARAEGLDADFLLELQALGISILPSRSDEVQKLGSNLFSLGAGRLLSPADNERVNAELEQLGYRVIRVEIDQFTRCGGGMHCLTMPLARLPG
jgi:N-dimethylarginine dimethylaminohydrolase